MAAVFAFSFDQSGFEAIVDLTAIDQDYVMAKMAGTTLPQSVSSVLSMLEMRARFNQHRNMEVWLLKLEDDFTEEELFAWAQEDPQAVADLARRGEPIYSEWRSRGKRKIV